MSIRLLSVVLDSLADKNPEHNIEWYFLFYFSIAVFGSSSTKEPQNVYHENEVILV